ncbi:Uncharacterized protein BM_BM9612 [Brugia malayi]|uniref:Mediator of RNA polymerase II transcription subunit 9 n=1 Tax=Brugia malayi TaxID=6279 RepID=A0A0K0JZW4_BRUMA|nr:Uncharacterized protein BM_BM9612 [Brugia malayi]CRZ23967.1 Bm9612 [Brugia malayi]VIO86780.1 Uncharacterized protein BM_BM9612 [Brugia malayi]
MSVDGTTALKNLNNIYNSIHNFIALAEKGNSSDIALKLRHLEASLEQLKEAIDSTSDIIGNENYQRARIADLNRRITLKDGLINSFRNGQCSFGT